MYIECCPRSFGSCLYTYVRGPPQKLFIPMTIVKGIQQCIDVCVNTSIHIVHIEPLRMQIADINGLCLDSGTAHQITETHKMKVMHHCSVCRC